MKIFIEIKWVFVMVVWATVILTIYRQWPQMSITDWSSWLEVLIGWIWLVFTIWLVVHKFKFNNLTTPAEVVEDVSIAIIAGFLVGCLAMVLLPFWASALIFVVVAGILIWNTESNLIYSFSAFALTAAIVASLGFGLFKAWWLTLAMVVITVFCFFCFIAGMLIYLIFIDKEEDEAVVPV